ncbi:MAG: sporulation protein [Actinomycetia bacterium]|nr:sporulation protein [Actinomycetes bacterium]
MAIQNEYPADAVFENIRGTRDALSVRRVFGDPYELEGVTIIPVARVAGGAGGGGGEGTGDDESGSGFGGGFGLGAYPVGVYEVRDGHVEWKPTVDVGRLAKGGQVLAGIMAVCLTLVFLRKGAFRA